MSMGEAQRNPWLLSGALSGLKELLKHALKKIPIEPVKILSGLRLYR
jgi:hypothetical protein